VVVLGTAVLLLGAVPPVVGAAPTTTTTPAGQSVAPPIVTLPGATTTTTAPPTTAPPADAPSDEAPPDEVPPPVSVPPPANPPEPRPDGGAAGRALAAQLKAAEKAAARADAALADAGSRLAAVRARFEELQRRYEDAEARRGAALARLGRARAELRTRAVGAYTGDNLARVNLLLSVDDVNAYVRRAGLLEGVLADGRRAVREYEAAKRAVGREIAELVSEQNRVSSELTLAEAAAQEALAVVADAHAVRDALRAGSLIAVSGFVFPVAAEHSFSNDFGAPRMVGTPLEHRHEGTDVFAEWGAPLVACERGILVRVGTDRLGGQKLWLVGQSGTAYYYAHLSAFAPGVADGVLVEAGTLIGFVGDSGNARGGRPHLHFEVHPGGGPAVNPYYLLRAVDAAGEGGPDAPPSTLAPPGAASTTTTAPRRVR
jgi:murein DD-endopeptidase MepM/ murein hydrolase activator NlpD